MSAEQVCPVTAWSAYHEENRGKQSAEISAAGQPKCLTVAFYARWSNLHTSSLRPRGHHANDPSSVPASHRWLTVDFYALLDRDPRYRVRAFFA